MANGQRRDLDPTPEQIWQILTKQIQAAWTPDEEIQRRRGRFGGFTDGPEDLDVWTVPTCRISRES